MKIDLHIHTKYSADCSTELSDIIIWAKKRNIDIMAITDHNTIEGALELSKKDTSGTEVVIGEEITLRDGTHLIGLFLKEKILAGEFTEAVKEIKKQGGVVLLPHLFRKYTGILYQHPHFSFNEIKEILGEVDLVEGINAKSPEPENRKSLELLISNKSRIVATSDAHNGFEIGKGFIEIEGCFSSDALKEKLLEGELKLEYLEAREKIFLVSNLKEIINYLSRIVSPCKKFIPSFLRIIFRNIRYLLVKVEGEKITYQEKNAVTNKK